MVDFEQILERMRIHSSALQDDREWARQACLKNSSQWKTSPQEHLRRYALQHYAEHLLEAKRWDDLFSLARNETFLHAQKEEFLDEPGLTLQTLRSALRAAILSDDPSGMAEFLLMHARRLVVIVRESPLDALHISSLERAWKLADLHEIERRVLWHLLLAFELNNRGDQKQSRATLERLRGLALPRLAYWEAESAVQLLSWLKADKEIFTFLSQELLSDKMRDNLKNRRPKRNLVREGFAAQRKTEIKPPQELDLETLRQRLAPELAMLRQQGHDEQQALLEIAEQQTEDKTFADAVVTARHLFEDRSYMLQRIAAAQTQEGDHAGAFSTAMEIQVGDNRSQALTTVATAQLEAGDLEEAKASFALAFETTRRGDTEKARMETLKRIAEAQTRGAEFATALQTARMLTNEWKERDRTVSDIARARAEAGDVAGALETAYEIMDEAEQGYALADIAVALVAAGETDSAIEIARRIEYLRLEGLTAVSRVLLRSGELAKAAPLLEELLEYSMYSPPELLIDLAMAQAQHGQTDNARKTFGTALDKARATSIQQWRIKSLLDIAAAMARSGEVSAARDCFSNALDDALQIETDSDRSSALLRIAKAQAKAGEFALALETVGKVKEEFWRELSLCEEIAQTYLQNGDCAAALNIARDIRHERFRMNLLSDIAVAAANQKKISFALETVQIIEEPFYLVRALTAIAAIQTVEGDQQAARVTCTRTLEVLRKLVNEDQYWWNMSLIANLAKTASLAEAADTVEEAFALALEFARKNDDKEDRCRRLEDLAETQALAGFPDRAYQTAEVVLAEGAQPPLRAAAAFAQTGNKEHFKSLLIPCTGDVDAALEMCVQLAHVYPAEPAISQLVAGGNS